MTSLINSTRYTIDQTAKTSAAPHSDVVVVPTLVGLQKPTHKVVRALQIRRRLSDFLASVIGGVSSI